MVKSHINKPVISKIEFTEDEQDIIKKINEGQPVQSVRTKVSKDGIKTDIITHTRFTNMAAKKRLFVSLWWLMLYLWQVARLQSLV